MQNSITYIYRIRFIFILFIFGGFITGMADPAMGKGRGLHHKLHFKSIPIPPWSAINDHIQGDGFPTILGEHQENAAYVTKAFRVASYALSVVKKDYDMLFTLNRYERESPNSFLFVIVGDNPINGTSVHPCIKIKTELQASPTDMYIYSLKYAECHKL